MVNAKQKGVKKVVGHCRSTVSGLKKPPAISNIKVVTKKETRLHLIFYVAGNSRCEF